MSPLPGARNKRVAHKDRSIVYQREQLADVLVRDLTRSIELINEIMNQFQLHYFDKEVAYDGIIGHGTGEHLLIYLRAGLRLFDLQKQLATRKITEEEFVSKAKRENWRDA